MTCKVETKLSPLPLLLIISITLTSLSNIVYASDENFRQLFKNGEEAFKQKHYSDAKKYFLKALNYNIRKDLLYFNLGSTSYRLNDLQQAIAFFKKIPKNSHWFSLSQYNIALCYIKTNQKDLASKHLNLSYRNAHSQKQKSTIRQLGKKYHLDLNVRQWKIASNISYGNHQNIGIFSDPNNTGQRESDNFFHYFFHISTMGNRWKSIWQYQTYNYNNENEFDFSSINMNLRNSKFPVGFEIDQSWLDSNPYLTTSSIFLKTSPKIIWRTLLHASYQHFGTNNINYRHLEGNRFFLDLTFPAKRRSVFYRISYDNRKDYSNGNEFKSYSPISQRLGIKTRYRKSDFTLTLNLAYTWSYYYEENLNLASTENRSDHHLQFTTSASKRLSKSIYWMVNYALYKHISNFAEYDYQSSLVNTALQIRFNSF